MIKLEKFWNIMLNILENYLYILIISKITFINKKNLCIIKIKLKAEKY